MHFSLSVFTLFFSFAIGRTQMFVKRWVIYLLNRIIKDLEKKAHVVALLFSYFISRLHDDILFLITISILLDCVFFLFLENSQLKIIIAVYDFCPFCFQISFLFLFLFLFKSVNIMLSHSLFTDPYITSHSYLYFNFNFISPLFSFFFHRHVAKWLFYF